ncbi:MAG: glycine cleavage system protein T [Candidatus Dadabacteria bacterium]
MRKTPLYDIHSSQGAVFGNFSGWLMPKSYGAPLEEYACVRNRVGIADLSHRGKLRLSGKEHIKFLQGMVTNDVNRLKEGEGLYAALLTPKGRMISDMRLYRQGESLLLDLEPGLNEKVRNLLARYKLSYKANIEDVTESLCLISIHGPNSGSLIEKVLNREIPGLKEYEFLIKEIDGSQVMIVRANRTGEDGYDIFISTDGVKTVWESLVGNGREFGLRPVGLDAMEILRIEAAIPRYGIDMDDNTIPLEAGLENAISYEKGCYVGQEVIARIKWRGHVNWCLAGFEIEGEGLPARDDKIRHGEREIGYITSSTFSPILRKIIALGYIRREFIEPGTRVIVNIGGEDRSTEVVKRPFYQKMVGGTGFEPVTSTV